MSGHDADRRELKNPEMLPEPDPGQQPAGEPPAESHAVPPAGPNPALRVESQEAEEIGFKTASSGSQQGTTGEPEAGDAGQDAPSRPEPLADSRRPVEGIFKTPHWVAGAIVENQKDAVWWANRDDLKMLRTWSEKLIDGLDLRVNDEGWDDEAAGKPARGPWRKVPGSEMLGVPLIKIERMNIRTLADYRPQADGYAISGTIVINEERLRLLDPVMKRVLMLVLLVRVRQHLRGGDGRLDREGRALLKAKGVVVTERGKVTIKDGAFRRLLEAEGIEAPVTSAFPRPERKGRSTLQPWSCYCQLCYVGKKVFSVVCPECHEPFRPGDHRGQRFLPTGT